MLPVLIAPFGMQPKSPPDRHPHKLACLYIQLCVSSLSREPRVGRYGGLHKPWVGNSIPLVTLLGFNTQPRAQYSSDAAQCGEEFEGPQLRVINAESLIKLTQLNSHRSADADNFPSESPCYPIDVDAFSVGPILGGTQWGESVLSWMSSAAARRLLKFSHWQTLLLRQGHAET